MHQYKSYAGYFGAVTIILFSYLLVYFKSTNFIPHITYSLVFSMVGLAFLSMLISEYFMRKRYNKKYNYKVIYKRLDNSLLHIFKSSLLRFLALFLPFLFFYLLVENHYYFLHNKLFDPTRLFADYLLYIFLIIGFPYIFLTLLFRGDKRYEFGDYAIVTIIATKSLAKTLFSKKYSHTFYKNRRVKKVWLLYLVNFFFLTLMSRFIVIEFQGFEREFFTIGTPLYYNMNWYEQYRHWYLIIFHLIFTIDVSIGIIGYSFASRWLDNRTKSVDTTMSGWVVALLCYPPLNTGFTAQFISYGGLDTQYLITDPHYMTVILVLLIFLYSIYVWSTITLGFKFSNLTNRGIVDFGPYKYVRHPAYISKNLSWWIDNTYVLTNIWAIIAMALWNTIYISRALTEERHLKKDIAYENYAKKVKYRFIPKII